MRTTLEIDEALLKTASHLMGERNKGRAVNRALEEYVRRKRIEELIAMAGKIEVIDNWREMEDLELKEMKRTTW